MMQKTMIFVLLSLIYVVNVLGLPPQDQFKKNGNQGMQNGNQYQGGQNKNNQYSNNQYSKNQYSNCKRFENTFYQCTVTYPGQDPLYSAIRFLSNGIYDEISNIAGGHNSASLNFSVAFSDTFGTYKCLPKNSMNISGIGYLYKTHNNPLLKKDGAVFIQDYFLTFYSYDTTANGLVQITPFEAGKNPYTTSADPLFPVPVAKVKCEKLNVRPTYDLNYA